MGSPREICKMSLVLLVRPLVRFALRHSIKLRDLTEHIKYAYVHLAKDELLLLGESVTVSKISAMSGLQRPEVSRLLGADSKVATDADIITRVIGLWQNSKAYKDKAGRTRALTHTGREGEFAKLVASVSTDLNPYTVAFELERAGIAKQTEHGLKLIKEGYESLDNIEEGLSLLAKDSSDLYRAVDENIFDSPSERNLHIKTEFDNIPVSKKDYVRRWFSKKGADFHAEARTFLSTLDRDINPSAEKPSKKEPSMRAMIGTFSFTENDDS